MRILDFGMRNGIAFVSACAGAALVGFVALAAQTPAFRIVEKGANSNVDGPRQAVAKTAAEFTTLYRSHNFDKPAPIVDFSKEIVVAVFMGSRNTAGYSVDIAEVVPNQGGVVVRYKERTPMAGGVTAQVLTAPYVFAAIPKNAGTVTFEKAK
jgi:hypothetical protein